MFAFLLPLALSLWLANWLLRLLTVGAITLLVLGTSGCYMGLRTSDFTMEAHDMEDYFSDSHIHWRPL